MNKRVLVVFAVLFFPLVIAVAGEAITGKASEGPTDVSVFVLPGPPIIYLDSPKNTTYAGTSFLLNYSIRNNVDYVWYRLDNGQNISLGNLTDNVLSIISALGTHSIYLYANNSLGETSKNVSFILSQQSSSSSSSSSSGGGSSGGGGGGSSGGGVSTLSFELDKKLMEVSLIQGESKKDIFTIKNLGGKDLMLRLELEELDNFAIIDEMEISLGPGESKSIDVNFFSLNTFPPGIYVGKINIFEGNKKDSIVTIVEIKPKVALFDVGVKILKKDKIFSQGDEISTVIDLTNIGLRGTAVDVELSLSIVDLNKDLIKEYSKETLAIKDEITLNKKLQLPETMVDGTYLLVADLKYQNVSASSYDSFDVKEGKKSNFLIAIILLILLIVIVLVIIKLIHHLEKLEKEKSFNKPFVKEED
ncbi:hypothetical protein HY212_05915 [Candidatus Pacearchaeota archaeon]|nr:hypothetical protein [Candidatus Pacearchaeota archaeon]